MLLLKGTRELYCCFFQFVEILCYDRSPSRGPPWPLCVVHSVVLALYTNRQICTYLYCRSPPCASLLGLFGMFFLREPRMGAQSTLHLPSGQGRISLAIEDKKFYANGSMWYPTQGLGTLRTRCGCRELTSETPSW